jgi:hypothetical protein
MEPGSRAANPSDLVISENHHKYLLLNKYMKLQGTEMIHTLIFFEVA